MFNYPRPGKKPKRAPQSRPDDGEDGDPGAAKLSTGDKKVLGTGLAEHEVHLVVTPRPAEMVLSAKTAHEWLAKKVLEWNERHLKKKSG